MPDDKKELSVTNDGQGVSVRSQWSMDAAKLIHETSPIRAVARTIDTNSNELEILVDRGEPDSAWTGELDPRSATNSEFLTRHKIPVFEHYAYPSLTLQMLEDSAFSVEDWLMDKVANRFTRQEAAAFVNGTGTGQPKGLLNYGTVKEADFTWGATPSAYKLGAQYTGVDGDITDADVLFDLVDSVKAGYLPRSSWLMTRAFRNKVRKLKDNQDRYLLQPSLEAGVPDTLLGYPVYLAEDMPSLAADVVGALFGDFQSGYTIVDRIGLTVQRDAVTQPGWVKYYVRRRIGGAVTNPEAIKALVLGTEPA
jgi:HK97 family phage major capsid protein